MLSTLQGKTKLEEPGLKPVTEQTTSKSRMIGKYEMSPAEAELADQWARQSNRQAPAPKVKIDRMQDGSVSVGHDHDSQALWHMTFQSAFGTTSQSFAELMLEQLLNVASFPGSERLETIANGAVAAMHGIAPRDETEAMLALQMVATHQAAMECYRRAMIKDQTFEGRQAALNQGSKLSRTHAALLETLNKHRGKGKQTVTVEHVHVNQGGQAIVGAVEHGGRGNR